jgi:tyrosyl-tRNA synthetase
VSLRGCEELIPQADWVKKRPSEATGCHAHQAGAGPTAPDIHISHTVLNKMRQLQDLRHQVIFLIGDCGLIGDPSGRNNAPAARRAQIRPNASITSRQPGAGPARRSRFETANGRAAGGGRHDPAGDLHHTVARMTQRLSDRFMPTRRSACMSFVPTDAGL